MSHSIPSLLIQATRMSGFVLAIALHSTALAVDPDKAPPAKADETAAEEKAPGTPLEIIAAMSKLMGEVGKALDTVNDEATAKLAAEQVDKQLTRINQLGLKARTLPRPTDDEMAEIRKQMQESGAKLETSILRLRDVMEKDPAVAAIINPLGARLKKAVQGRPSEE